MISTRTASRHRARVFALLAVAAAVAACTSSGSRDGGDEGDETHVTAPVAVTAGDVAAAREGWTVPNGDHANTRVADATIDASNVDDLAVAWSFSPAGSGQFGAFAGEPLIADDTVYVQDLASNLYALALDDGTVRWEAIHDAPVVGPNGPALGDDHVYVPVDTYRLVAYDLDSGAEAWRAVLDSAASQPTVVGDTVYASTDAGNYAGQTSGFVYALDATTGEQRWAFQVVEDGFWGDQALNSGGGVWLPPAVDQDRGHVYWGTGNPAPFPGTADFPNAASRPGPNLYTNSLVAIEAATGELAWYDQVEPGDLFDHDFHGSPILVDDLEVDGAPRDLVIGAGKNGEVGAWDRATSDRLWLTEVGTHRNDDLTELPIGEPVEVYPGTLGGVETPMAAADGVVYVPVVNLPTTYEATGFGARNGLDALIRLESPPPTDGSGELVALDVATGELRWTTPLDLPPFAGATVVNDLVFTATFDGTLLALRRDTGAEVWRFTAPAGVTAWPAVHGDTIVWGAGAGPDPQLLALRLGGGTGAATGGSAPRAGAPTESPEVVDGVVQVELITPAGSAFDRDTLTVPTGADVALTYDNRSEVAHNVAILAGPDATSPVLARTEVEAGPVVQTLTFTAPDEPGVYRFRCDPHPTLMVGTLVVE